MVAEIYGKGEKMMSQDLCPNCGANEFIYKDDYRICRYCNSKLKIIPEKRKESTSSISLQSDIERLLQKCKDEPWNSRKYAGLILDIDPTNREALRYLR